MYRHCSRLQEQATLWDQSLTWSSINQTRDKFPFIHARGNSYQLRDMYRFTGKTTCKLTLDILRLILLIALAYVISTWWKFWWLSVVVLFHLCDSSIRYEWGTYLHAAWLWHRPAHMPLSASSHHISAPRHSDPDCKHGLYLSRLLTLVWQTAYASMLHPNLHQKIPASTSRLIGINHIPWSWGYGRVTWVLAAWRLKSEAPVHQADAGFLRARHAHCSLVHACRWHSHLGIGWFITSSSEICSRLQTTDTSLLCA